MRVLLKLPCCLLSLLLSGCVPCPPRAAVFAVKDYGAVGDGRTDDSAAIREAVTAAIQSGKAAVVRLEGKRYRVSADAVSGGKACLSVSKAAGLAIEGAGADTELISSSPEAGLFQFHDCANVSVRKLVIDYDPPPYLQGTITALDPAAKSFEWRIDEGYAEPEPERMKHQWGIFIDRRTGWFKPGAPSVGGIANFERVDNRRWVLTLQKSASMGKVAGGDAFAMRGMGGASALFFVSCGGAVVEDVVIHAAPGLCMGFVRCEGDLVVRRVTMRARPGSGRLLSGNADGIHCQTVRKGPLVEDCHFEGMTDDGMNTYDRTHMVTAVVSPSEIHVHDAGGIREGDRIQVMDPHTGLVRGVSRVTAIRENKQLKIDPPIGGMRTSAGILQGIASMTNHLDADVVYNLDACGAGYVIRRNYFGRFRGRGLVLRGHNGLIEDNVFDHTSGPGVVIANEPNWPEGPVPAGVTIRGNKFRGVGLDAHGQGYAAIMVMALGLKGASPHPGITGTRIEDNRIEDPPATGIHLSGCDGVLLKNNRITADDSRVFPSNTGVGLSVCRNVVIDGLVLDYRRPATTAGVTLAPTVASGDEGVRIGGLKAKLPEGAVPVLDRRAAKR